MNNEQKKIIKAIKDWAAENYVDLTDTHFWTRKQWKDRKEEYCLNAILIVSTEGDLNHILNCYDGYTLHTSFFKMIEKLGYWFEMGTHWYFGIYKD